MLGIRRIADHGIDGKRLGYVGTLLVERPVLLQRVGTAGHDVLGDDATHHEVHAGEVVGVLLQFLGIVFHLVLALDMLAHCLADGNEQRTGAGCGVVDLERLLVLVMLRHNLRHHHRHLVGRIELARLLAGTGCKVADEVFIDVAQHIVVLRAVGRDVLDELDKPLQCLGLRTRVVAQLAESLAQGLEDAVIYTGVVLAHQSLKTAESLAERLHAEPGVVDPSAEEILVLDEEADMLLTFLDGIVHVLLHLGIVAYLHEFRQFILLPLAHLCEILHFRV